MGLPHRWWLDLVVCFLGLGSVIINVSRLEGSSRDIDSRDIFWNIYVHIICLDQFLGIAYGCICVDTCHPSPVTCDFPLLSSSPSFRLVVRISCCPLATATKTTANRLREMVSMLFGLQASASHACVLLRLSFISVMWEVRKCDICAIQHYGEWDCATYKKPTRLQNTLSV